MSTTRTSLVTALVSLLVGCGSASPPASTAPDDVPPVDVLDVVDVLGADTAANDVPVAIDQAVTSDAPVFDAPVDEPSVDVFVPDLPETADVPTCLSPRQMCGDACVDQMTDPHHCGGCNTDCTTLPGVDPTHARCAAGACDLTASCLPQHGHCSASATTGCETDLTNPLHCGSCSTTCAEPSPFCSMGSGGTYACASGCSGLTPTRCDSMCADLTTDPNHCGSCGHACSPVLSATTTCTGSVCGFRCNSGTHACGARCASNIDPATCGSTCVPCPTTANATATCDGTSCGFVCNTGYHLCGGVCVDNHALATCGGACAPCVAPASATATCDGTACGFVCVAGFHSCSGACVSNTALATCGASCAPCPAPRLHAHALCTAGVCGDACDTGFHDCSGVCVSNTDVASCGASCSACPTPTHATATCDGTTCGSICQSGYHACTGTCLASTSTASCGSSCAPCTVPANASATCNGTSCGFTCNANFADCDGAAGNGCEVDLRTTATSCGTCGHACTLPNATAGCTVGACTIAACSTGFADCNGSAADGCETDIRSSTPNCGVCGHICAASNATPVCSAGTCAFSTCNPNFGNCDGNATNGCETMVSTLTNCGSCGTTCPAPTGPHTVAACGLQAGVYACGAVCQTGWTDCDGNIGNGCEVMGACYVSETLFYDNLESGVGNWTLGTGWGTQFGSDCTGAYDLNGATWRFPNGSCPTSGSAAMLRDIDASRAVSLLLTYQDWSSTASASTGRRFSIDVSTDRGATWISYDATRADSCGPQSLDLTAFAGQSTVRVRFTFGQSCSTNTNWDVDEIRLSGSIRQY